MQNNRKKKLVRITTVPISLEKLLTGQLSYMNNFYEVTAISSEKENLERFGKQNNIAIYYLHLTRKITPIQDFIAIVRLWLFLLQYKPDIVHTHTPKAGMVGMIAAKLAGVPNRLHTVAGLPLLEAVGLKRKILNWVEKLTYACATKVYPNSKGLEEIILENKFVSKQKLKIIGNGSSNGINTTYFSPHNFQEIEVEKRKADLGINASDFVFVFVGRLVKDKGIQELVSVFKEMKFPNLKLLLVGPLEQGLDPLDAATLQEIENNKNIVCTGYQEDVRLYFLVSDALVFPSYREGFPNVVLQAGAMGLPSIVTDINGCNEIITNHKNGIIIPVKNKEFLAEAMESLLKNRDLYLSLQQNARKYIVDRYEQKAIWEAIHAEYLTLGNV